LLVKIKINGFHKICDFAITAGIVAVIGLIRLGSM
jgi:hypothetical protein